MTTRFTTSCTLCPAGTFRLEEGASSAAQCLTCAMGDYAPDAGSESCLRCPALAESDTSYTAAFQSCFCPAGTFKVVPGGPGVPPVIKETLK